MQGVPRSSQAWSAQLISCEFSQATLLGALRLRPRHAPRSHGQVCSGRAPSLLGASISAPSDTSNDLPVLMNQKRQTKPTNQKGQRERKWDGVGEGKRFSAKLRWVTL